MFLDVSRPGGVSYVTWLLLGYVGIFILFVLAVIGMILLLIKLTSKKKK